MTGDILAASVIQLFRSESISISKLRNSIHDGEYDYMFTRRDSVDYFIKNGNLDQVYRPGGDYITFPDQEARQEFFSQLDDANLVTVTENGREMIISTFVKKNKDDD